VEWIEVGVKDNGPGIAAEQAAFLFEPSNTSRNGIGLGLSICKTILQAHGGQIWLSSSAVGLGRGGTGTGMTTPQRQWQQVYRLVNIRPNTYEFPRSSSALRMSASRRIR
jgi:signal transduction histidine kinase